MGNWYQKIIYKKAAKEPWEMTKDEFVKSVHQQKRMRVKSVETQQGQYAGMHEAPTSEGGSPGYDVTLGTYPDDIYGPMAAQYYGHYGQNNPLDVMTIGMMRRMQNRPDKLVRIYRAVPKDVIKPTFSVGDWVTINRAYATEHGESTLEGNYKIISKQVHARDIWTDGNSIHEWGYDPQEKTPLRETPLQYISQKRLQDLMYEIPLEGHQIAVAEAVTAGKPVPPEVLAEYPELTGDKPAPPTNAPLNLEDDNPVNVIDY